MRSDHKKVQDADNAKSAETAKAQASVTEGKQVFFGDLENSCDMNDKL